MTKHPLVWLALLPACRPADPSGDTARIGDGPTLDGPGIVGAVEKGPFLIGSTVTVSPTTDAGEPEGDVFITETVDDLGRFAVDIPRNHGRTATVALDGTGFYFDEIRGDLSHAPITLRALAEYRSGTTQTTYLNVLTHLAHSRVKMRLGDGQPASTAIPAAEDEVDAALGIAPDGFDRGPASALNLLGGDTDRNAYLFAVSAILLEVAHEEAGGVGSVDAELQRLLNTLASDLASDGDIDAATRDRLHRTGLLLNAEGAEANLGLWFDAVGSPATVPDLRRILPDYDLDNDGHLAGCDVADLCDDCDDTDPDVAVLTWWPDADADGFGDPSVAGDVTCSPAPGSVLNDEDCDDDDAMVNPDAVEVCDGIDDDCDGDADSDAVDRTFWVYDFDGDRHYSGFAGIACEAPPGTIDIDDALGKGDCDDADPAAHPGAAEVWYDGIDQDCLGGDDFDQDGDGYHVAKECDDTDASINWGAKEICDGIDQDCDGAIDEGTGDLVFWIDADGDGYALPNSNFSACAPPPGTVSKADLLGFDCDDGDKTAHPGAKEIWYDNIDQACDGGDDFDQDGDGASAGKGGTDCNDLDSAIGPNAFEKLGDKSDFDCDGSNDGTSWRESSFAWASPTGVVLVRDGGNILLNAGALHTDLTSKADGYTLYWQESTAADVVPDRLRWNAAGAFAGPIAADQIGGRLYVAHALPFTDTAAVTMRAIDPSGPDYVLAPNAPFQNIDIRPGNATPLTDVEIGADAKGNVYGVACGPNATGYAAGFADAKFNPLSSTCIGSTWAKSCELDGDNDGISDQTDSTPYVYPSGTTTCWLDPTTGAKGAAEMVHLCGGKSCGDLVADPLSGARLYRPATQPSVGLAWKSVDTHGGWRMFIDGADHLTATFQGKSYTPLGADTVRHVDISGDGSSVLVAAIVPDRTGDGIDDVILGIGAPGGPLTTYLQPLGRYVPDKVTVVRGAVHDVIAVAAHDSIADPDPNDLTYVDKVAWIQFLR